MRRRRVDGLPDQQEAQLDELMLREQWTGHRLGTLMHLFCGDQHVGKLAYRTCPTCRLGLVAKISIYSPYDRRGAGRQLIATLVKLHPGLTWHTTGQQPSSVGFWRRMALDYGSPFTANTRPYCEHAHTAAKRLEGLTITLQPRPSTSPRAE